MWCVYYILLHLNIIINGNEIYSYILCIRLLMSFLWERHFFIRFLHGDTNYIQEDDFKVFGETPSILIAFILNVV